MISLTLAPETGKRLTDHCGHDKVRGRHSSRTKNEPGASTQSVEGQHGRKGGQKLNDVHDTRQGEPHIVGKPQSLEERWAIVNKLRMGA